MFIATYLRLDTQASSTPLLKIVYMNSKKATPCSFEGGLGGQCTKTSCNLIGQFGGESILAIPFAASQDSTTALCSHYGTSHNYIISYPFTDNATDAGENF